MKSILISYKTPTSAVTSSAYVVGNVTNTTTLTTGYGNTSGGSSWGSGGYVNHYPTITTPNIGWYDLWFNVPPVQKLPKEYCSSSFPACDIYEDADKNLVFELCVAGYKEEDIEIEFEEDYLYLYLKNKETDKGRTYLQKGIKSSKNESEYYVPFDRYIVSETTAKLNEGILTITIPMKEDKKPLKVKLSKQYTIGGDCMISPNLIEGVFI